MRRAFCDLYCGYAAGRRGWRFRGVTALLCQGTNLDEGRDRSFDVASNFDNVEYTERVRWGRFDGVGLSRVVASASADGDTTSRVRIASSSFRYGQIFYEQTIWHSGGRIHGGPWLCVLRISKTVCSVPWMKWELAAWCCIGVAWKFELVEPLSLPPDALIRSPHSSFLFHKMDGSNE